MKKSKLLIPALSVAGVAAVVAPMVTSCSESIYMSTTNIKYAGDTHDEVESAWTLDEGITEYFKDKKYLAQDFLTAYAKEYGADVETAHQEDKNVEVSINIKVNNLTLGDQKQVKIGSSETETTGYLVSGSVSFTQTVSYDKKLDETEATTYSNIYKETKTTYNMRFSDCFAYLGLGSDTKEWLVYIYGCKNAADWEINTSTSSTYKTVYTLLKDSTKYTVNGDYSNSGNAGAKSTTDQSVLPSVYGFKSYITSNYLSKVEHKAS